MKKIQKIGGTILAIMVISVVCVNNDSSNVKKSSVLAYNASGVNLESAQLIDSLKATFGDDYEQKMVKNELATKQAELLESKFEVDTNDNIIYPDNYGGSYINENNELVVQIVDNLNNNKLNYATLKTNISLEDNTLNEVVKYSYNDLISVNEKIVNYFLENGVTVSNFVANYIDVYSNRVVVELKNIDSESIDKFKREVYDSEVIEFKVGERADTTASYKVGAGFYVNAKYTKGNTTHHTGRYCSFGARAKRNGVSGYITAGHCFGYMDYTTVDATIANGTYVTRSYSQTMDAAFVKLNSGNTVTNNLSDVGLQASMIKTTGQNYYTTGTAVGKDGSAGKYGTGLIKSLSFSGVDKDGYYHSGLTTTNITAIDGDSGGPVFIVNNLTSSSGAPLIGITSVGNSNLLGFYDYNKIVTALGLTKY